MPTPPRQTRWRNKARAFGRTLTRTLYIAKADEDIWYEATDNCKKLNIPLSSVVADLLRIWVESEREEK
jgi:hypothetical protein